MVQRRWVHRHAHPEPARSDAHCHGAAAEHSPSDRYSDPAAEASTPLWAAFRQGLRDLGYAEGTNIVLEYRFAAGQNERLPELAAELVRVKVDIIVTNSGAAAQAARNATDDPIVMATSGDPVRSGLVASLARPGGNITGLNLMVRVGRKTARAPQGGPAQRFPRRRPLECGQSS